MCIDRLEQGLKPICVLSCSMRALEFGPLMELEKKCGNLKKVYDMPRDSISDPSVVFKLPKVKKRIVPWDAEKTLKLWQKREPFDGEALPDVFTKVSDVIQAPIDIVGRNKLVMKSNTVEELMYYTMDDE